MGNKPQYLKTAELLAERISYGDYLLTEIPSSRKLAEEFGVSHIVARKAVEKLLADGLCRRMENGRIAEQRELTEKELSGVLEARFGIPEGK